MSTPSLAPGTFTHDTTVFIVLNDFGKLGSGYVDGADESTMVSNIVDGQYSNPVRVVAFNTHEGWSRDVTENIARKIIELGQQGRSLSAIAREFVGRVTGESLTVAV